MMLKFEIYMMDAKHTLAEHLRSMLTVIHDLESAGNNLSHDQ